MPSPHAQTARVRISRSRAAPRTRLSLAALRRALALFLDGLGYPRRSVSLSLTGDAEMRALNRAHRGADRTTDVLSWSYLNGDAAEDGPLGDLALSLERARAQARANGWSVQTEVLRLLAHGCAHLAGYDHQTAAQERRMRPVEERLLERVGLMGLYPPAAAQPPARTRARALPRAVQQPARAISIARPARRKA